MMARNSELIHLWPSLSLRRVIALAQLLILVPAIILAIRLDWDNGIDRFAVQDSTNEFNFQEWANEFREPPTFLVSLTWRIQEPQAIISRSEEILDQLVAVEGISRVESLARLVPNLQSLADHPLPFPFLQAEQGRYNALVYLDTNVSQQMTMERFLPLAQKIHNRQVGQLERLDFAGEPLVNYELNRASLEIKERLFPLLVVVAFVLIGFWFRSIHVLLTTVLAVISSLTSTLAVMELGGHKLNLITTLVPVLIFVLAVAMQVHLLIGIAIRGDTPRGVLRKLKANMLVAVTTSLGFGSLMASSVEPIAEMGRYMALGIWIIFFWCHLTHMGYSAFFKVTVRLPKLWLLEKFVDSAAYHQFIQRRWLWILPVSAIPMGAWFLLINPAESNGLNYFPENHPIRHTTDFVQENVAGTSDLELLLPLESMSPADLNPGTMARLEENLLALPQVTHLFSLNRISRWTAARMGLPIDSEHSITTAAGVLEQTRPEWVIRFRGEKYLRIRLLVYSLDLTAYEALTQQVRGILAAHLDGAAEVAMTGTLDRIITIQRHLLRSLGLSLGLSITLVVVLMALLLGRFAHPLRILLPNLFPLACMALAMAVLQIKTSISSVMVFSIAFGIAVDDTIHLLDTYYLRHQGTFEKRWRSTVLHDLRAIAMTTMVLAIGFSVLILSSFIPTRNFGFLLTVGMISALVADVFFLPMVLGKRP